MSQTETTWIFALFIVLIIGLRIWRASREQRIKLATMWVAPALFFLLTAWIVDVDGLTQPLNITLIALAVVLGGAIGMYQGNHTTVRIDRQAKVLYVKARPLGIAIFVAVIALRLFIRLPAAFSAAQNGSLGSGAVPLAPKGDLLSLVSVLLLALALGGVAGLRLYLLRKFQAPDAPA
jgi:predicted secreted protein